jgi:hypothetical protein
MASRYRRITWSKSMIMPTSAVQKTLGTTSSDQLPVTIETINDAMLALGLPAV